MSQHVVGYDADGWITLWLMTEGGQARRPLSPREHPVDAVTHAVTRTEAVRFLDGELAVPHDDREAWKRYRQLGHSGPEAFDRARRLAALRSDFKDAGPVVAAVPHGSAHGNVSHPFDDVPGLVLRPFGAADFDLAAPALIEAGIYLATCPGTECHCNPPEAHAWLQLAQRTATGDAYQFCLEFNGQPLQHEIIVRDQRQAVFSLTVHYTRERPSWFWREAERPVFAMLYQHGVRSLESRTRSDRPDWIQSLKDNYGAAEIGVDPTTTHLAFPLDLTRFTGWPARKTGGLDWGRTAGAVTLREATEADFPAVLALLDRVWDGRQDRRALTGRMLEEWWHLDRATLLLGSVDGQLRDARLIRPRKPGTSAVSMLAPAQDDAAQDTIVREGVRWMAEAGYTAATMFIPAENWASAKAQRIMERAGWTKTADHTKFRAPFTEVSLDLTAALAKPEPA